MANIQREALKSEGTAFDEQKCVIIRPSKDSSTPTSVSSEMLSEEEEVNNVSEQPSENVDDDTNEAFSGNESSMTESCEGDENWQNVNSSTTDSSESKSVDEISASKGCTSKKKESFYASNLKVLKDEFGFTDAELEALIPDEKAKEMEEIARQIVFEDAFGLACDDENIRPSLFYHKLDDFFAEDHPEFYGKRNSWFKVFSMDENSGIQALEKINPDKKAEPAKNGSRGKPHRQEFNYKRHGTTGVIAFKDVITGKIPLVYINKTRTERDLAVCYYHLLMNNKEIIKINVVEDNLNTHSSEALVRLTAAFCGYEGDLGAKGRYGILKNKESRMKFLSDPTHRVVFYYTPTHCSWLNQVEVEFSIFNRRFYNGNSFKSVEDLEERIAAYFEMHNKYFAKAFRWKYNSVPENPQK